MVDLPPPITEAEIQAIKTSNEEEIKEVFAPYIRDLHSFLNNLPCIRNIQQTRRMWVKTKAKVAFGNFETDPNHWYTYNIGGRNEAQFNIGMHSTHLRIGLGFEFTPRKWGDPTKVGLIYAYFTKILRDSHGDFNKLARENIFEIEYFPKFGTELDYVPNEEVTGWLIKPPMELNWLLVGRLLRYEHDKNILEDPVKLKFVIENVFGGIREYWKRCNLNANK